jgi:hypothetical protein
MKGEKELEEGLFNGLSTMGAATISLMPTGKPDQEGGKFVLALQVETPQS